MAEADRPVKDTMPSRGKVGNVRDQWRYFEDGAMASEMQDQEFGEKYNWNRNSRRTARIDVPTAKVVQSEEEEKLQRERMLRLEEAKRVADQDEEIAQRLLSQMIIDEQDERIRREMNDEEVARKLQEQEADRYQRKRKEVELKKQRQKLEADLDRQNKDASRLLAQYKRENGHNTEQEIYVNSAMEQKDSLLRKDGKIEDLGDFSDFYVLPTTGVTDDQKDELVKMQDEEMARLLQEQEHKRGGVLKRDKLKAIEAQDEELARVMQEQEELRYQKRKEKKAAQRQKSLPSTLSETPADPPGPPAQNM